MPEGTAYVSAAVRAQKILLEQRLVHWVHRTNRQQGVAPTTSMVLDVAEEHRVADPRAHVLRPHVAAREGRADVGMALATALGRALRGPRLP